MRKYELHSDTELLDLLAGSDEKAFAEIYERFWKKLFAVAYSRLKETESAEDIAHDVFASLWHNRKVIKINTLENYLATATKYMVLARIRKIERERQYKKSAHQSPLLEIYTEDALHHKRILELVNKEVENLPEKCKLIFHYSRNKGMPVKDIAEKLNISSKTVENQLNKALKHLRLVTKKILSSVFSIIW